jgi:tagatose 1,6-diphosphate aldolase
LENDIVFLQLIQFEPENPITLRLAQYRYRVFEKTSNQPVGWANFRIGTPSQVYLFGHIGYAVDEPHRGHGYAYQACLCLFSLARQFDMDEIIITCNPDNVASHKTLDKLDGVMLEIAPVPEGSEMYEEGDREKCIFSFAPFCYTLNQKRC